MPNFKATNNFKCPYCNEMLNGASGFFPEDKPKHDSLTICVFCAEVCVYVIHEGNISLRKMEDDDHEYLEKYPLFKKEVQEMIDFVKSNPQRKK